MTRITSRIAQGPVLGISAVFICYAIYAFSSAPFMNASDKFHGVAVRIAAVGAWLYWGYRRCPPAVDRSQLAIAAFGACLPAILGIPLLVLAEGSHENLDRLFIFIVFTTYSFISALFAVNASSRAKALGIGSLIFVAQFAVDFLLSASGLSATWSLH